MGLLLIALPGRILASSGIARPATLGPLELGGIAVSVGGALLAVWRILTFALVGTGTPAPFDPPRQPVVGGPYRYVRNPVYLGAGLALGGVALFYRSAALLIHVALFLVATHLIVPAYEGPTLARLFGSEYDAYPTGVHRWLPRMRVRDSGAT